MTHDEIIEHVQQVAATARRKSIYDVFLYRGTLRACDRGSMLEYNARGKRLGSIDGGRPVLVMAREIMQLLDRPLPSEPLPEPSAKLKKLCAAT